MCFGNKLSLFQMPGGCLFNAKWTIDPEFKEWIKSTENVHQAYCKICKRQIVIKTMGRTGLTSHMKGKKHIENISLMKTSTLSNYIEISKNNNLESSSATGPCSSTDDNANCTIDTFVSKTECLNAEILWCVVENGEFKLFFPFK